MATYLIYIYKINILSYRTRCHKYEKGLTEVKSSQLGVMIPAIFKASNSWWGTYHIILTWTHVFLFYPLWTCNYIGPPG